MDALELLQCPFCGGDECFITSNQADLEFVCCPYCGAEGPSAEGMACVAAWGSRLPPTRAGKVKFPAAWRDLVTFLSSLADQVSDADAAKIWDMKQQLEHEGRG